MLAGGLTEAEQLRELCMRENIEAAIKAKNRAFKRELEEKLVEAAVALHDPQEELVERMCKALGREPEESGGFHFAIHIVCHCDAPMPVSRPNVVSVEGKHYIVKNVVAGEEEAVTWMQYAHTVWGIKATMMKKEAAEDPPTPPQYTVAFEPDPAQRANVAEWLLDKLAEAGEL